MEVPPQKKETKNTGMSAYLSMNFGAAKNRLKVLQGNQEKYGSFEG